jgi:putative PIN family toxin of toxin-antitoxin system
VRTVTLDSNIYVSALEFRSKGPRALLDMALEGTIRIAVSQAIIEETLGILRTRFRWKTAQLLGAEATIRAAAMVVTPTVILDVVKDDPDDDRIVECAASSRSEAINTNDGDLLRMKLYDGIRMMRFGEFLRELEAELGRSR